MKVLSFLLACLIFVSTTLDAATKRVAPINHVLNATLSVETGNFEFTAAIPEDIRITINGSDFTLRAGTLIVAEAAQTYGAKNLSPGQTINIRVKYNVVVRKETVISAGALGTALISEIKKPKMFGKGGKMEIQIQSVQAVDGQQILLSGIPMTVEGESKSGLAWGVAIGAGLLTGGIGLVAGLFIKGKPAELRAGTTLNASVASDTEIEVNNP